MSEIELKPCPCCGGDATFGLNDDNCWIGCESCSLNMERSWHYFPKMTPRPDERFKELCDEWNRRTSTDREKRLLVG